jgi:hypothetical protein
VSILEKRQLERVLRMGSGYLLNFSDRTFQEFVADSIARDIYDERYNYATGSKANRLRGFWKEEGNRLVGQLLKALLDYAESECSVAADDRDMLAARRTLARLLQDGPVAEIDALSAVTDERDFEAAAKAIREAIEKNEPEAGLDRLHTFVIKYVRSLCERAGITVTREKPLHSLFGEYVKFLEKSGVIESAMTLRILKSSISTLEAFNDVRNNQSLAHDNPILNYEEALLIFNHVAASVRFLRAIERRRLRSGGTDGTTAAFGA